MGERPTARPPSKAECVWIERVCRAFEVNHVVVAVLVFKEGVDLAGGDHASVLPPRDCQLRPETREFTLLHDGRALPRRPLLKLPLQLQVRRVLHAVEVELDGPMQLRAQTAGLVTALPPLITDAGSRLLIITALDTYALDKLVVFARGRNRPLDQVGPRARLGIKRFEDAGDQGSDGP